MERKLNVDIASSIFQSQSSLPELELKRKMYRKLLRGRGLEFDGYRSYAPDDDASTIDWKASKRGNSLMVKQYKEETDLKVLFVLDVSDNMVFGSQKKLKCEYAAEISVALANLVVSSGNKIGFILFSNKIKEEMRPEKRKDVVNLFGDIVSKASLYGNTVNYDLVLDYLVRDIPSSVSVVFFVSDFIHAHADLLGKFKLIGNKFETIAIMVKDPLDSALPDINEEIVIEDSGSGEQLLVNPKIAGKKYEYYSTKDEAETLAMFRKSNIDVLSLKTNDYFVPKLSQFLKERVGGRGK